MAATLLNGSNIPAATDFKTTAIELVWSYVTSFMTRVVTSLYGKQIVTADGAITILEGYVTLSKGSALAMTIAPPTATTDDGKKITLVALTAQAHVVTQGTVGFNAKGSSGTLTFGGAIGDTGVLMAYQGNWYVVGNVNVTAA